MSKSKVSPLPHSWLVSDWPSHVTPNRCNAGKQLVRAYRAELIECGALVRIGRNLTIIGEGYAQFLARKAKRVAGYEIAPNRQPSNDATAARLSQDSIDNGQSVG